MPNPGPTRVPELTTANPVPRATETRIESTPGGRQRRDVVPTQGPGECNFACTTDQQNDDASADRRHQHPSDVSAVEG